LPSSPQRINMGASASRAYRGGAKRRMEGDQMVDTRNGTRRRAAPRRHALILSATFVGAMLALAPSLSAASSHAVRPAAPRAAQAASPAAAQTFTVSVDAHTPENQSAFLAYYPKAVSAHAGDTITFALADSGEPHTVTFGTIVDKVMAKAATGADLSADPDAAKLPSLLPQGPGDANQVAANPCFLASGDPPTDAAKACPATKQPAFDGTSTFYNSGWIGTDQPFTVTLSDTIKPGTYSYLCLLHGTDMSGSITVVDAATAVKTPAEVTTEGQTAISDTVAKLQPALAQAAAGTPQMAAAGIFSQDVQSAFGTVFGAQTLSVPVGGSVTWLIMGPHTISFNAPQDAVGARAVAPDGTVHLNVKAAMPAGGPGQPQAPPGPAGTPDPNAPPTPIDAGTWDGTTYLSSGFVVAFPPSLFTYKVTFSKAGSYKYQCLIHTDMAGTIKVGS
jgi:plastocyanin